MGEKKRERERGKIPGSRVISPSQHRPLNSTPLVETKSDTRKAKLLQMHKPSSVHPPFPYPPSLFVSLFPHSEFATPLNALFVLRRPFLVSLSTLAPFSYLLILSQPFSLRKRRSAIHPFPSSTFPSPSFSLTVFLRALFPFLCAARGRSTSLSMFPLSLHQRKLPF